MTPTYDQAELFLAPLRPHGTDRADRTPPTVDHGAAAMRVLCDPFAARTQPAAVPAS
ncbi:hypothetical protein GCM10010172_40540 [Paractinoplanes ferrugineus]|uniref:Uncharacterized protein n=1 Tax=Paractinoplanes ferrugineus TaxID=113564 RepID=A0A919J895_9ACTN|nr:hypothetical protein [Actinoplanes ferrugineus]GIE16661.1 hypothetical protein Afe05nite_85010 [Actinoplanes ferrugineus]